MPYYNNRGQKPYGRMETHVPSYSTKYPATNIGYDDVSYYPNTQLILVNLSPTTTLHTVN
jgi:hypothetical protein